MFKEKTKQELFKTLKAFHACKQEDGHSVSSYLLKMKSYLDTLTIAELYAMLKLHEKGITKKAKTPAVLAIRGGMTHKNNKKKPQGSKGETKLTYAPKPKIPSPPKRDNLTKNSICHNCKEVGH
nr:hypothetical protein [Tanacetum cinerariifolium]